MIGDTVEESEVKNRSCLSKIYPKPIFFSPSILNPKFVFDEQMMSIPLNEESAEVFLRQRDLTSPRGFSEASPPLVLKQ